MERTLRWVRGFVVGLELCPFAGAPLADGRVRIVESAAREPEELVADLDLALSWLARTPAQEIETLLLVHPHCLLHFHDYNQFLGVADARIEALGLRGELQIASFHPGYRFADAPPEDPANLTNRSPHPMLHLLREASVERAVASVDDPAAIPRANVARLRALGYRAVEARRDAALSGESDAATGDRAGSRRRD